MTLPMNRQDAIVRVPLGEGDLEALLGSDTLLGVVLRTQWPARYLVIDKNEPNAYSVMQRVWAILKPRREAREMAHA
jgi:hypothetical protein